MLTSPDSPVVRHRLAWLSQAAAPAEAGRLAQVRPGTLDLFPPGGQEESGSARACAACGGAGFTGGPSIRETAAVARLRPPAATAIDQCHLDAGSLARRVAAITALRPAACSRVACVGDDDLASIALLRSEPPSALLVADIDERILSAIAGEASRLGAGGLVSLEHLNLTHPGDLERLLEAHGESYDLVVTDPPYAEDGMRAFARAAMRLTAFGGELHIAVPALLAEAWSDELLWQVQGELNAGGFIIERLLPGTFTYETSDVISSLVVARRLPGSQVPALPPALAPARRFYTTRTAPERLGRSVPLTPETASGGAAP
jgi:predicted methyltransferase